MRPPRERLSGINEQDELQAMPLKLHVTSYQRRPPSEPLTKSFGQTGGSIGRGPENDWVLPDPDRYVSQQHAVIEYRDGSYYVRDTSANGLFLNEAQTPLGKGNSARLAEGDSFVLGDYKVEVSLLPEDSDIPWKRPSDPHDYEELVIGGQQSRAEATPTETSDPESEDFLDELLTDPFAEPDDTPGLSSADHASDVETDDFLSDEPSRPASNHSAQSDHVAPIHEPYKPPNLIPEEDGVIPEDWDAEPSAQEESGPGGAIPEDWDESASPDVIRSSPIPDEGVAESRTGPRPESRERGPTPAKKPLGTAARTQPEASKQAALLREFLAAAGCENFDISDEKASQIMRTAGEMLREAVQGSLEVLRARNDIRHELRVAMTTIRPVENNPLKFSPDVEEALFRLLVPQGRGYMAPVSAIREAFDDIKSHEVAVMAGMQAALKRVLARFDPALLEERLRKQSVLDSMVPMHRKARTWELFTELYAQIVREAEEEFDRFFGEEFAREYEEQSARLRSAAKMRKSSS